ncbi:MAG TPA: hypothetical protein DDY32_00065 [Desulfobulbaceae bacterium]|nr:hypothetical protein [Desulfobulbaceae bacterium]
MTDGSELDGFSMDLSVNRGLEWAWKPAGVGTMQIADICSAKKVPKVYLRRQGQKLVRSVREISEKIAYPCPVRENAEA